MLERQKMGSSLTKGAAKTHEGAEVINPAARVELALRAEIAAKDAEIARLRSARARLQALSPVPTNVSKGTT